tara:strand:+ start:637 stop:894 length:258 start_codon:yes stop_codon:yes gene_type:complete
MKYTKCYLSEVGHKNFFYPTTASALITDNCDYSILPWVGGENKKLTPIKIKKSCVIPLNMTPPESVKGSTVVWVETHLLPLSSAG